uniref:Uncharacterized protein n=1 Tax=Anguilla anguilla TaxID=7936 RepID=A0A0E9QCN6_ANGAN
MSIFPLTHFSQQNSSFPSWYPGYHLKTTVQSLVLKHRSFPITYQWFNDSSNQP